MKNDAYFHILHALHGLTLRDARAVLDGVNRALIEQSEQAIVNEHAEFERALSGVEITRDAFGAAIPPRG